MFVLSDHWLLLSPLDVFPCINKMYHNHHNHHDHHHHHHGDHHRHRHGNIIVTVIIIMIIITKKGKLKAQLCQTLLRRMNRDFGNLTFLPEKKLRRNFKLFKKSFPESSDDMDFAYFQDFNFEILCFGQSCIFSPDSSYFLPVGVVPGKYLWHRVKSNFANIGPTDLLFKVSVFVLRCIFGYYGQRSRKPTRNLTVGQCFPIPASQNFGKG